MRLRRLDRCLAICCLLSVLWFLSVDRLAESATCDNVCRMRQSFYDDGGKSCSYFVNPDCLLCRSVAGMCVQNVNDKNVGSNCPAGAGNQRVFVNGNPNSCTPQCPFMNAGTSQASQPTLFNSDPTAYHKCQ